MGFCKIINFKVLQDQWHSYIFLAVVGYTVSAIVELDVVAPIVVEVVFSGVVVVEVVVAVVVGLRGSHPDNSNLYQLKIRL